MCFWINIRKWICGLGYSFPQCTPLHLQYPLQFDPTDRTSHLLGQQSKLHQFLLLFCFFLAIYIYVIVYPAWNFHFLVSFQADVIAYHGFYCCVYVLKLSTALCWSPLAFSASLIPSQFLCLCFESIYIKTFPCQSLQSWFSSSQSIFYLWQHNLIYISHSNNNLGFHTFIFMVSVPHVQFCTKILNFCW